MNAEQRAENRNANYIAPAHSAEGQECAQCGQPAWHVQLAPFCRDHDQGTWKTALIVQASEREAGRMKRWKA